MTMGVRELPPRGHYLASEVGRLAGVSGQTIGQWARRGYIRASQSDGNPKVYSYQDIAEAMVVHELLDNHVAHRAIMNAIENLREQNGTAWPLTQASLHVPADHQIHTRGKRRKRHVIVEHGKGKIDATTGHPVIDGVDLVAIASDLRSGGWAARRRQLRHIEVNPDRLSGRPTIAGTRVPAEDVARLAAEPAGRKVLREEYGLADEQVEDAVAWWQAVTEYEAAA